MKQKQPVRGDWRYLAPARLGASVLPVAVVLAARGPLAGHADGRGADLVLPGIINTPRERTQDRC